MEDPKLFYSIPKHLNKGKTVLGLPQSEVLPALLIFTVLFVAKYQLIGFILAAFWFMGLRIIKLKFGENIIPLSLYWFGDESITKKIYKATPPSQNRYWIY